MWLGKGGCTRRTSFSSFSKESMKSLAPPTGYKTPSPTMSIRDLGPGTTSVFGDRRAFQHLVFHNGPYGLSTTGVLEMAQRAPKNCTKAHIAAQLKVSLWPMWPINRSSWPVRSISNRATALLAKQRIFDLYGP